jgi:integrase
MRRARRASSWLIRRETTSGPRWRVLYRVGGRESSTRYAGSFKRKEDAVKRKRFVDGELAVLRVPDLQALAQESLGAPTLAQAAERWRESRVDVAEQTANMHRSAFVRIFKVKPELRARRVDVLSVADVAELVAALAAAGYMRETLRKSRTALAQTLDGISPNPVRDERVKLPRERKTHLPPPLAEHVERVLGFVAPSYRLPLALLDVTGARVNELVSASLGDLDEERLAIRVRPEAEKNERYRYLQLSDDLSAVRLETVPPWEDRDEAARLFPGLTDARLRMAITRACRLGGVPHFSPHSLRGGVGHSTTSERAHSPRWLSSWASRSGLPPTTTSTRSPTTAKPSTAYFGRSGMTAWCVPRCVPHPGRNTDLQGCSIPSPPIEGSRRRYNASRAGA